MFAGQSERSSPISIIHRRGGDDSAKPRVAQDSVCEFADVFPEELDGLPPVREIEFQDRSDAGDGADISCTLQVCTGGIDRVEAYNSRTFRRRDLSGRAHRPGERQHSS